jgi:hypothetical protein
VCEAVEASGQTCANPYAAQRAIGDGLRQVPVWEVAELRSRAQAPRLVRLSAGHDAQGHMTVTATVSVRGRDGSERPAERRFTTTFTPAEAPLVAFHDRILPDLLKFAGIASVPPGRQAVKLPAFPPTPAKAMAMVEGDALSRSLAFQLLGSLAPQTPERASERFFEQSLIALERLDPADPTVRLLRARALMHLHGREAALAALGKADSPAAQALQARINGNYPEMKAAMAQPQPDWFAFIGTLELSSLAAGYKAPKDPKVLDVLLGPKAARNAWKAVLSQRLAQDDAWDVGEDLALKVALEATVPVAGLSLEEIARGKAALGRDLDPEQLGLTVFEHVEKAHERHPANAACDREKRYCGREAWLDLIEALAISNAHKSMVRAVDMRGTPGEAASLFERYRPVLDGEPDIMFEKAAAIVLAAEKSRKPMDERDYAEYGAALHAAAYWEQGQSLVSGTAAHHLASGGIGYLTAYEPDLPLHVEWPALMTDKKERRVALLQLQLANNSDDLLPVEVLMRELPPDQSAALGATLQDRFHGNPARGKLAALAPQAAGAGGEAGKLEAAAAGRRERPDVWENYGSAVHTLVEEKHDYAGAAKVALSFPGFSKPQGYDAVALGNYAFEAGSLFYWRGEMDPARKLFKVAAAT